MTPKTTPFSAPDLKSQKGRSSRVATTLSTPLLKKCPRGTTTPLQIRRFRRQRPYALPTPFSRPCSVPQHTQRPDAPPLYVGRGHRDVVLEGTAVAPHADTLESPTLGPVLVGRWCRSGGCGGHADWATRRSKSSSSDDSGRNIKRLPRGPQREGNPLSPLPPTKAFIGYWRNCHQLDSARLDHPRW